MNGWQVLAAGQDLERWLRKGGQPEQASRSLLWLYRWRAFWLEHHFTMIRNSGPAAQPFPYPNGEGLIFILGFWRSGTTLLHELLADAPGCGVPRTWQCMDPSALLLVHSAASTEVLQRPMDQVLVTADSPQEDEFALMAMGVPSIYRGFLDPRRLPEVEALLDQDYWSTGGAYWQKTLECFLSWCREAGRDRLVVKSPNHLFRYRALALRYPRARFVWILRSPAQLWRSNLAMWRAMVDRYALWNAPVFAIEGFLTKALISYADLLSQLHQEGLFQNHPVFSYEELMVAPEAILLPLADRLGLKQWDNWGPPLLSRIHGQTEKPISALSKGAPLDAIEHLETLHRAILWNR